MKKLFLGLAVAASSLTFAQQFGAKAGLNVSSLSKDAALSDQGSKVGFHAGLFMNMPIASSFSIQPEVLFTQYGDKYDGVAANGTRYSSARHLNYITVPVMLQYNVLPSLHLEAGPEFGFIISAKDKVKDETNNNTIYQSQDFKELWKPVNFGLGIGAGYDITENLGVGVRYVAGLSDASKNWTFGGVTYDDNVKNNVFQASLSYKF